MTVDILPDVALLEIFDFYVSDPKARIEAWHMLVHVCRKWRNVVFGSPRRLNLRLHCGPRTPVREMLDIWPSLPISVFVYGHKTEDFDSTIAALEHKERISEFCMLLAPHTFPLAVLPMMQQPFPALRRLYLNFQPDDEAMPVVPNSFLGGSAPHLQEITLVDVPFPGLPKLLFTATRLVTLELYRIPHSGYISPEAMVACLSSLTSLEDIYINFESPRSRPGRRPPPPRPTRTLLPALTRLKFRGVSEYLDEFVARIDVPLLTDLDIAFFHQLIFDTPQLALFIGRTPKFETNDGECHLVFTSMSCSVEFPQTSDGTLELEIKCEQIDWQLSSLVQICNSLFTQAHIHTVERLYIFDSEHFRLNGQDDTENSQWLELLHPFATVKDLYISQGFTPHIAPVFQELVGETVTDVLPALRTLFLEDTPPSRSVQEAIEQFTSARQLAGRPIAVSYWERNKEPEERSEYEWLEYERSEDERSEDEWSEDDSIATHAHR